MRYTVSHGTPAHLTHKECATPSKARDELKHRLTDRINWASAYNRELADEMRATIEEVGLPLLQSMKPGEERKWTFTDEHSQLTFVHVVRRDA